MSYYKGGRGGGSYRGGGGSSYRGNRGGEGGNWRGGSSRGGSGFVSSSRGSRYSSYPSPNYDSRSRSYAGGAERYSRTREEPYHRYSQDVGYSTRDYNRAMSPEPPRKRARPDSSPNYMAPRRSHERSFASEYSSGRSFYDKGGASSSGGGYIPEKAYTREVRERGSDFAFRKPAAYSSPRGGFRGRSSRGLKTRGFRSTSSFLRKRDSFALRKRIGLSSRSEYLRRLRQLRLRRRLRAARRQKASDDEDDDAEQDEDKEEEEGGEEEEGSGAEVEGSSEEEVEEEEEMEEEEEVEEKGDEEKAEGEEGGEIKEETTEEGKEKKEGEEASPKKTVTKKVKKKIVVKKVKKKAKKAAPKDDSKAEDGEKEEGDKEKEENEGESDKPLTDFLGQPFIKLKCPHCAHLCVTFKEYSKHLETRKHQNAMQELFTRLRKTLATMRTEQRKKQRALDDDSKSKNLRLRTFFCSICKLNYRTLKAQHLASASHRKMSEFLLPFCKVCRVWFKSAWSYESHLCELPHIKKKARLDKLARPPTGKDSSLLEEADDLDTSSFMILDSVGSGDDSDIEKSDDAEGEKKEGEEDGEKSDSPSKKKKKKSEIKLGAEFCKIVEVYYCDLCKMYLPRLDDKDRALTIHCRSRTHLQRYVRLSNSKKNDATLRRKAVRLHKERQKLKEKVKKEKKEDGEVVKDGEADKTGGDNKEGAQTSEGGENAESSKEQPADSSPAHKKSAEDDEEKMWSEVDKDLSDLLHEGDEQADDDEDTKKERFDRFKQSDKHDKNSVGDSDIKANGTLPIADKKKVVADGEEN